MLAEEGHIMVSFSLSHHENLYRDRAFQSCMCPLVQQCGWCGEGQKFGFTKIFAQSRELFSKRYTSKNALTYNKYVLNNFIKLSSSINTKSNSLFTPQHLRTIFNVQHQPSLLQDKYLLFLKFYSKEIISTSFSLLIAFFWMFSSW